jgi:rod shape-determining protein MreD
MRIYLLMLLTALVTVVLQTTVLPGFLFGSGIPDVLLVLGVYLGLHQHSLGGALGAFALGYVQDSVAGVAAGLNAFGMSVVFLLVYLTSRRLWVDNVISRIVVVFLASLIKTAGVLLLLTAFRSLEGVWSALVSDALVQAALAAVVAPPLFAVLTRAERLEEASAR